MRAMHQLVALALFLVFTLGRSPNAATPSEHLAYLLGTAATRVVIFMALHVVVYFGVKRLQPSEKFASFSTTRLNYLTLALLVFIIAAQLKHG